MPCQSLVKKIWTFHAYNRPQRIGKYANYFSNTLKNICGYAIVNEGFFNFETNKKRV